MFSLIGKDSLITQKDIAQKLGVSLRTIERNISILKKRKLIIREGSDKNGYWIIIDK